MPSIEVLPDNYSENNKSHGKISNTNEISNVQISTAPTTTELSSKPTENNNQNKYVQKTDIENNNSEYKYLIILLNIYLKPRKFI